MESTIAPPTPWTYALRTVGIGSAIGADVLHGTAEYGLIALAAASFAALYADIRRRTHRAPREARLRAPIAH